MRYYKIKPDILAIIKGTFCGELKWFCYRATSEWDSQLLSCPDWLTYYTFLDHNQLFEIDNSLTICHWDVDGTMSSKEKEILIDIIKMVGFVKINKGDPGFKDPNF